VRGFAGRAGIGDAFVAALGGARRITREPKPVRALREVGLEADLQSDESTTDGIIALLFGYDLVGRTVGVQLYGEEPNLPLMEFLCDAGATADPVAPYAYADEVDGERVTDPIERIAAGGVDVLALTSAS
jgi:uroporphyrinogen-III synthase